MTEDQTNRLDQLERATAETSNTLNAIEAQMQRWEENQKWQINDMRSTIKGGITALNASAAVIIGLLAYIAYRLS